MSVMEGPTLWWVGLAVVAAIVEVSTPQFGVIFVSAGALVAALFAAASFSGGVQIAAFVLTLVASLTLVRPRILLHLGAPGVPSRTEVLIGREAMVTHDIDPSVGAGRVNVGGEDW